jgi:hypothetical protein
MTRSANAAMGVALFLASLGWGGNAMGQSVPWPTLATSLWETPATGAPQELLGTPVPQSFWPLDSSDAFVKGGDNNLWFEYNFTGRAPPPREKVDGNVLDFQGWDAENVFVRGMDGNLWLEQYPFKAAGRTPKHVDANVSAYQGVDPNHAYVLDNDGDLWFEHDFDCGGCGQTVPPPREPIDVNVYTWQVMNGDSICVQDWDGNVWLENKPYKSGGVTPTLIGNGAFQAINVNDVFVVFVLDENNNLWLHQELNGAWSSTLVDGNVYQFQAVDANHVFVLGYASTSPGSLERNLWIEHDFTGNVPPPREQVDGNVANFIALDWPGAYPGDAGEIYVFGTDGNVWFEQEPFKAGGKTPLLVFGVFACGWNFFGGGLFGGACVSGCSWNGDGCVTSDGLLQLVPMSNDRSVYLLDTDTNLTVATTPFGDTGSGETLVDTDVNILTSN